MSRFLAQLLLRLLDLALFLLKMVYAKAIWLCIIAAPLVHCVTIIKDPFNLGHVPYVPLCGHACRETIQENRLECSPDGTAPTSSGCFASNTPYLTTLAYCLSTKCKSESFPQLNSFWTRFSVSSTSPLTAPLLLYEVALKKAGTPNVTANPGTLLKQPSLVLDEAYEFQLNALSSWDEAENTHSKAAYVVASKCLACH